MTSIFNLLAEGVRMHVEFTKAAARFVCRAAPHAVQLLREATEAVAASELGASIKEMRDVEILVGLQVLEAAGPVIAAAKEFGGAWKLAFQPEKTQNIEFTGGTRDREYQKSLAAQA